MPTEKVYQRGITIESQLGGVSEGFAASVSKGIGD